MWKNKPSSGLVTSVFLPVGLLCVLALCFLTMAVLGAQAYQGLQGDIDDNYSTAVTANYLRTKLAQHGTPGAVEIREENGTQVLVLTSTEQGALYETRIFVHEGYLQEFYVSAGQPFAPANGVQLAPLAPLASCSFSISANGLFSAVFISPQGTTARMAYALTPGGGL